MVYYQFVQLVESPVAVWIAEFVVECVFNGFQEHYSKMQSSKYCKTFNSCFTLCLLLSVLHLAEKVQKRSIISDSAIAKCLFSNSTFDFLAKQMWNVFDSIDYSHPSDLLPTFFHSNTMDMIFTEKASDRMFHYFFKSVHKKNDQLFSALNAKSKFCLVCFDTSTTEDIIFSLLDLNQKGRLPLKIMVCPGNVNLHTITGVFLQSKKDVKVCFPFVFSFFASLELLYLTKEKDKINSDEKISLAPHLFILSDNVSDEHI